MLVKSKHRNFIQLSVHSGNFVVIGKPAILFWMWHSYGQMEKENKEEK